MTRAAAQPRPLTGPWIFGPATDLLIGCGAWSLPLLAIAFYLGQRDAVHLSFAFYALGVFCNQPHYMATVYRAYHTPHDFNRYRFFTIYVTIFIVLTAVIVHLAPALFPWLLTFYLTWSPWHYSGQNYGISMMLIRRAGGKPTDNDRNLIWWSYVASYAVWFLALHNTATAGQANLYILPIPQEYARLQELFFFVVYLVAGGIGHFKLVRQIGVRAMAGPLTLYTTQFLWFLLPELLRITTDYVLPPTYSSAGILAFMHCAQYLWITSYYAKKENSAEAGGGFRFGPYYLVLILSGIALFIPGPWVASRVFGYDLVESFFIFSALINLHHFILDGAIWKLRDGRIARLLLGRNPPVGDPADAALAPTSSRWQWWLGKSTGARTLRVALALSLLGLAFIDQTQFWLTLKTSASSGLGLAQQLNPQDTRVYFQHAKQLAVAGDTPAAMAELRRAIAINPRNVPIQHLLGELLLKSGDTQAALEHYDRMAVMFPPDYVVLVNSGLLATQRGESAKSLERFEAALRLAPHDSILHLYLGQAHEIAGDFAAAMAQYGLYLDLHAADLTSPAVLPNYLKAALKTAELAVKQNQRATAIALHEKIATLARGQGRTEYAELAEANLRSLQNTP